jgi:hypothetical protein
MWKKLFVFLLSFGVSLLSLQFLKPKIETNSVEVPSNPVISSSPPAVRSEYRTSVENRSSFENFLDDFQKAVARNDRETVVSLVNFPVDVFRAGEKNKPFSKKINSKPEFLRDYDKIFDESFKANISQIDTNNLLFSSSGTVFVSPGVRMERFYKNGSTNFKIKIIEILRY